MSTGHGAGLLMAMAAALCAAGLNALVKDLAGRGLPVLEILFFRSLFGLIPVVGHIAWKGQWTALRTARPGGHFLRSAVGILGTLCAFKALSTLPLTEATGLSFTAPLFTTALSALVLGERVTSRRWAAVLIGFAGVLVLIGGGFSEFQAWGALLALGGALGAAAALICMRHLCRTETASTIVFYFTLMGVAVGALGLVSGWRALDGASLAGLAAAGLLGGVGQLLLTGAVGRAELALVAPFDYSQTVWAAGLGFLIRGEIPSINGIIGSVIIIGCGAFVLLHAQGARGRSVAEPLCSAEVEPSAP
jgi:drug/metabolite transporter (DMT)-like permease